MNHDVGCDHQARLKPEFLRNLTRARVYLRIQLSSILPLGLCEGRISRQGIVMSVQEGLEGRPARGIESNR